MNIALVGCGRIAQRYVELLEKKQVENAQLVAVCDIVVERARLLAEKLHIPFYDDMDNMMKGEDIDIVAVLTPSGMHAENVINLAKFKKHIIVEKPMALTLDDADAMIRACDVAGIKLFVVKQNRYNYPVQKLRMAIEKSRFGRLVLGTVRVRWCRTQEYYDHDAWRGTWAMDGGVFANQASHHIDLLEWMMGEPETVFAKAGVPLVNIETEDTGVAIIRFRNGALGIVEATTAIRPKDLEGSLSILGERGSVEIGGFAVNEMKVWNFMERENDDIDVLERFKENPPNIYGFGHKTYLEHVVKSVQNNAPALVDGLEGRKSLELIMAIHESIETGREVSLRFKPKKCKLGRR